MATKNQDVNLRITAEDQASPAFRRVSKAAADLTRTIGEQAAGVRSGETTFDELRATLRELENATKSLASQTALISSFRRQTDSLGQFEAKAQAARNRADEFARSLEGKTQVSARAQARLDALNKAADRTATAFTRQTETVARTAASLERAGIDVRDLDSASKSLLNTEQQLGAATNALKTVMSGYAREVKAGRAEERAAAIAQAETLQRRQAALKSFNDAVKEQARLRQAVLAAETGAAREETAAAAATQKQTAAIEAQVAANERLLASYGRLSDANVGLARAQGRGGAAAAVQSVIAPGSGVTNIKTIADTAATQAQNVQEGLGKPVQNYLGLLQDLERSLRSVQGVARQVDGYQAQRAAVVATLESYQRARANLRTLNDELRRNPTAENAAAVQAALPAYNRARAAFLEQLQTLRVLREELRQSGVEARNFGDTQRRLVDTTERITKSIKDLNRNFNQFGGSRREGAAGLFGLRPYEIQNLSFQINDFFTQLASGTSVTQAFTQQIGQVVQIQPIWTRLVAFAPLFVSLGAAIGVTTAALSRLYETSSSNRNFSASLALLTGGATEGIGITAERMTQLSRRMEALGFAFEDARKAAVAFLRDGVVPANLDAATEAALRLSRALKIEVTDATRILTAALRGGSQAVIALREAGIGLTQAQREAILAASNASDAYERQRQILQVLTGTIRDADENALSPFTRAINAAKEAWRGLLDELGNTTALRVLKSAIDGIAEGLLNMRTVGIVVARALTTVFAPFSALMDTVRRGLGALARLLPGIDEGPPIGPVPQQPGPQSDGRQPVGGMTAEQEQADIAASRRGREAIRDSRRATREQRIEEAVSLATEEFLRQFPTALPSAVAVIAEVARQEILKKLEDEASAAGRGAAAEIRRDFQAIQQDLQNALRIRDENIRGIQEDVASGALAPAQAIERIQQAADQARPAIERLRAEAQRFLESGRGQDAVRDSAIQRVIAQADRELAGTGGGRAGVNNVLNQSRQAIQQQFQERQQFIQTQNALEQQGLVTRAESERQIVALYGETNDALRQNIEAYEAANRAAQESGQITQAAARANAAQIELWRAQLERINPEWARLKQGIENTFVQSGATFFDSVAKALGDVIAGVTTLEDAWDAAGQAALQFFADILKGIAQVIIQEQLLQAVRIVTKSISAGLAHSGAVVGQPGGQRRMVNPAVFAGAPRMHSGGLVGGLRNDERAAILQTGEEVLSKDDPRNVLNGGMKRDQASTSGGGVGIRQVLAIGDQEVANAMSGAAGEQVFMTWLKRNAPTVRSVIRA